MGKGKGEGRDQDQPRTCPGWRSGRALGGTQRRAIRQAGLARMPSVSRPEDHMTPDEIECPECGGTGEEHFGSLGLACRFCGGAGTVDGPDDPHGHGGQPEGFGPPVGQSIPVRESGLCTTCLGAGVVTTLACDEGGRPTTVAEAPCPTCVPKRQ